MFEIILKARLIFPTEIACAICGKTIFAYASPPSACSRECKQQIRWRDKAAKARRKQTGGNK